MVANVSEFISKFNKDVARPCNFDVIITQPKNNISGADFEDLRFKCEATELPSRTFSLVEQKTYGPVQYFPVQNFYEKVNLTFICSDDMKEKKLFDNWMEKISDSTATKSLVRFDFNYKSEYSTNMSIIQYDLKGQVSLKTQLFEAFPISVHPLKLDWGASNEIHKLIVTFAYRYTIKE